MQKKSTNYICATYDYRLANLKNKNKKKSFFLNAKKNKEQYICA